MEIKNKQSLDSLIKNLTLEVLKKELDEMTSTGNIDGYNTPFFLKGKGKAGKKKEKQISTNSTGYSIFEGIDEKDMKKLKKTIRNVVANILRDIWIKRSAWKNPRN